MTRAVMVVLSNPASDAVEDEYNRWYDDEHLTDMLSVPGVTSATRFRLSDTQMRPDVTAPQRYLAIYEIDADDIDGVLGQLREARAAGRIPISDLIAGTPGLVWELISHRTATDEEAS